MRKAGDGNVLWCVSEGLGLLAIFASYCRQKDTLEEEETSYWLWTL